MDEQLNQGVVDALEGWNQGIGLVEKLFSITRPGAVFSEPVTAGEHTVITASEVVVGMGFGYGAGAGTGSEEEEAEGENEADAQEAQEAGGFGAGGGGGGGSFGRPVAAISIGPDGVRVDPILDVTKVGLAFLTAMGAMFMMLGKMRRAARG
jgi:uncharacterized spore protein YtfJ